MQIIQFWYLKIFQIHFDRKFHFLLFFSSWLREWREKSSNPDGKEKHVADIDLGYQNGQYLCQIISFIKGVLIRCFFYL